MFQPIELDLSDYESAAGHTVTAYRVDADVNGNPRYVVHYLAIPFRERREGEDFAAHQSAHIESTRRALGGKRYRAKWFGGGIVFQSYNLKADIARAFKWASADH